MLNLVGLAGALVLAAGLLRVAFGGRGAAVTVGRRRARAWRPLALVSLATLALALWHGWMALRVSPFVVLFALPGYLAAAILVALSLRRLKRAPGAAAPAPRSAVPAAAGEDAAVPAATQPPWGAAARLTAAAGLVLLIFSVVRNFELLLLRGAALPPPELRRQERALDLTARGWPDAFAALCADLAARYPFTAWKGIDWQGRCAATAPRIAAAAARRDPKAYYRALRELAWSIPDGHVGLLGDDHGLASQETGGDLGLRLARLADGRVVACKVAPGGAAARAGVRYGAEVLSWNGLAIDQALARTPVLWSDWPPATAAARRAEQLRFLPRLPVNAAATIIYRNRGAARAAAATLTAASAPPQQMRQAVDGPEPAESSDGPVQFNPRQAFLGGAVAWRRLAAGIGYIRIRYELPTLLQVDPARQVRRAVASLLDGGAAGIVLDVRGNCGGLDVIVPSAAGCFVTAPRVYEIPGIFSPAAGRFLPDPNHWLLLMPREPRFPGRVAVLIDGYTLSSGEGFPLALRGLPGVAVFGFTGTAGFFAIGQRSIRLPGAVTFVVPVGQSLGGDGRIQVDSDAAGRGGIAPDHPLAWTEDNLDAVYRDHRDPVLEAARRWLSSGP
jgi:carboxyl-terminal processing protease